MKNGMKMKNEWQCCPICKDDFVNKPSNVADSLKYYRCFSCELDALYKSDEVSRKTWFLKQQDFHYGSFNVESSFLTKEIEAEEIKTRAAKIGTHLGFNQSICEVGPGSGEFAKELERLNYRLTLVEQAKSYEELNKKFNKAKVINSDFSELKHFEEQFDAICTFHVIEHVPDLLDHLKKANMFTRPGGNLFIATPSANSLQHMMPFRLSPHYSEAHLVVLSRKALLKALEATGWEPVEVKTNEYLFYWLRVLTKIMRRLTKQSETATPGQYLAKSGLFGLRMYKMLRFMLFPLLKLQEIFGLGSELFIVARKKSDFRD